MQQRLVVVVVVDNGHGGLAAISSFALFPRRPTNPNQKSYIKV